MRFLRNDVIHCVFIRLHGNIFSNLNTHNLSHKLSRLIKADHEAAEHFIYWQIIIVTNDSENSLSLYANWLRSIFYCYLLTFGKLRIVTTGACAVVTKTKK